MEIRIGVIYTAREPTTRRRRVVRPGHQAIEDALGGTTSVLWLTDKKGAQVGVPVDKIAYVEIVTDAGGRKVGFGAS